MTGNMSETEFVKPEAKVIGENGNVYNILAICSLALKRAGHRNKAEAMQYRVMRLSGSYEEALRIMEKYVEFV